MPITSPTVRADFFGLARRGEAELAHRVDDAALHRLEPVADERQRAVEHHVHRVVEVRALGVFLERDLFEVGLQVHRGVGTEERARGRAREKRTRRRKPARRAIVPDRDAGAPIRAASRTRADALATGSAAGRGGRAIRVGALGRHGQRSPPMCVTRVRSMWP